MTLKIIVPIWYVILLCLECVHKLNTTKTSLNFHQRKTYVKHEPQNKQQSPVSTNHTGAFSTPHTQNTIQFKNGTGFELNETIMGNFCQSHTLKKVHRRISYGSSLSKG
uniref:Secreted protein n=1 Tax=Cacopsylla melanoneura TaxID=428564 RepID=A0A8D9BUN0_9HEMI